MNHDKVPAIIMIVLILGLQAWAISPWRGGDWYWPFIDYPMYSRPHRPVETFVVSDLRVIGCQHPAEQQSLDGAQLHVPAFVLYGLLDMAASSRPLPLVPAAASEDGAARYLARLVSTRFPERFCRAELWSRNFSVGFQGLLNREAPFTFVRAWSIPGFRAQSAQAEETRP